MTHKPECEKLITEARAAQDAYRKQWPDHCKTCCGWSGQSVRYDPSPAGVGLSAGYMYDFDTCPDCADKGLCPRCLAAVPEDAEVCPVCKHTSRDKGMPSLPEECWCDYPEAEPDLA